MADKSDKKTLLSVVVPAYKQERTIKADLENIENTLKKGLSANYDYEIICVVDGSPDKTESEARKVKSAKIKIISYEVNHGKGYAVRRGMEESRGELISFLDAGREIRASGIMMLMAHMDWYDADIIVGSKSHPASRVKYPFKRKILSFGYHYLVKILLGIEVGDTQSGIKIFKRKVVTKILPKLQVEAYAMDIEMLALARHYGFDRIYEAPIEIQYNFEDLTHASTVGKMLRMVWDTIQVFYKLKIAHYYD